VKTFVAIFALALVSYLIGSVSFAVITSRVYGLPDPRTYGSGNPGATNVLRTGKKPAAALTLVGDGIKGWVAVVMAARFAESSTITAAASVAAVAVVLGHMYPVFFRFKGGKGVATALGVLFGFGTVSLPSLYIAAGTVTTWLIIFAFFRISSMAALISAVFAAAFMLMLYGAAHPYFVAVATIAALLFWRHRANIRNLIAGTETRFGRGKSV
jgi:glycerol-3-phosphate acyltransferase PlsY